MIGGATHSSPVDLGREEDAARTRVTCHLCAHRVTFDAVIESLAKNLLLDTKCALGYEGGRVARPPSHHVSASSWNAHRNGEGVTRGRVRFSLFADDVACNMRDPLSLPLLLFGVEDGEATRLTPGLFREYLEESGGIALVAFSMTQSRLHSTRFAIGRWPYWNSGCQIWNTTIRTLGAFNESVRETGTRTVRPPKTNKLGLAAGDVLAIELPQRVALLRVVRVRSHRLLEKRPCSKA